MMQAIGMVTRFQSTPKETYALAVKRIFRYLKVTVELGLQYPRDENFSFTTYFDVDWVISMDD